MATKENKRERVLLLGASGAIGREVVKMLVRRVNSVELCTFDLPTSKNREFLDRYPYQLTAYYGDIRNPQDIAKAVQGVDTIIHLAAIIPPVANEKPELAHEVNVEGTRNLIEATKAHAPEAYIMMASSVAVYGDRLKDPYIKVGDPLTPADEDHYAETKIEMEWLLGESELKHTIFRLSAIMGMGNHYMSGLMFRMPLEQVMEICTPTDVARAYVYALNNKEILEGNIYNLGGGIECTTTYEEFLRRNFEIYGLGELDFPEGAFATRNYHCGYFEDGDELEAILHFRRDTLQDYYSQLRAYISAPQYLATRLMRKAVKSYMLSKSEPYDALVNGDKERIKHFFG